METRRSEWEEDKEFTVEKVRAMDLKKYNNLLTSGRWYNKYTKYSKIIALVGVNQKIVDNSNKSCDKSTTYTRESTKG